MYQTIDLYAHCEAQRPDGAAGYLDCYIQEGIPVADAIRHRPGVLIVPGGGYDHVSKREGEPVALRYAAAGYQAYVLRYSVSPLGFPHPLREAAMAMACIRESGNCSGVAAVGFSAGGHLCGMLGTMFDDPRLADIASADKLRPDVLGLCYPVAVSWGRTHEGSFRNLCRGEDALRQRLSIDRLARADMPPVFLWHTRDDESVPCRNSLILSARLAELGVEHALHIYRHGPHGLSTADEHAYGVGFVPAVSADVPGWLDAQLQFFREMGLKMVDIQLP